MPELSWAELEAACPVALGGGASVRITQDMVDRHAATTGDEQWIHNDPERARRDSPFGGPIAQGFLLTALLTQLSSGFTFPAMPPVSMMVNYGLDRVRFLSPVLVGESVQVHGNLVGVRTRGDGSAVLTVELEMTAPERAGVDARLVMAARWLFLAA